MTNTEWSELVAKCDQSVRHYDWLNGCTLFDANDCQMTAHFDEIGVPFVFSAIATGFLIEQLLYFETNAEFRQSLNTQLKNLLMASNYLWVKTKTTHWKHFSPIHTTLRQCLDNILKLIGDQTFASNFAQLLLEKLVKRKILIISELHSISGLCRKTG